MRRQVNQFSVRRLTVEFTWSSFPLVKPTVQVQQHVGLEQVLGPGHLPLRHTGAQRHPAGGRRGRETAGIIKDGGSQLVESQYLSNCNLNVFNSKTASPLSICLVN